ncbi:MAG: hypothetical protein KatS3mg108_3021 [Isosphaeraceae bacterium]|jgi:hypothetical protein|nr:MAG: hypothetical protein KatS3mg108_3021 [Isosphaeraceae bacterium]
MTELVPVLAQAVASAGKSGMPVWERILVSIPWFGWIAIVAIVSGSLAEVVKAVLRHNERIALIRMGMNPDGESLSRGGGLGKPECPEAAEL